MNHISNSITIVCYDITSNRLRNMIDRCLKDFGLRIQFSVFLCRLDAEGVKHCKVKLMDVLKIYATEKKPDDSLIIFERLNFDSIDCLVGNKIERNIPKFLIL